MKTIKQIADEIGVSKQAVSKRLVQLPPTEVTTNEKGVKLISLYGTEILKNLISPNTNQLPPTKPPTTNQLPPTNESELYKILKTELEAKNKLIDELSARLAETTSALVAAQQTAQAAQMLHAGTIQKQITNGESSDEVVKRKGFFGLFRK